MTELEFLRKKVADLERRLDALTAEILPKQPPTDAEIQDEVDRLVLTLGPDKAAEEINRRNTLRKSLYGV